MVPPCCLAKSLSDDQPSIKPPLGFSSYLLRESIRILPRRSPTVSVGLKSTKSAFSESLSIIDLNRGAHTATSGSPSVVSILVVTMANSEGAAASRSRSRAKKSPTSSFVPDMPCMHRSRLSSTCGRMSNTRTPAFHCSATVRSCALAARSPVISAIPIHPSPVAAS